MPIDLTNSNAAFTLVSTISSSLLEKVQSLSAEDWDEALFRTQSDEDVIRMHGAEMPVSNTEVQGVQSVGGKEIIVHSLFNANVDSDGKPYFHLFANVEARDKIQSIVDPFIRKASINKMYLTGQITKKYVPIPPKQNFFSAEIDEISNQLKAYYPVKTGNIAIASLVKTNKSSFTINKHYGVPRAERSDRFTKTFGFGYRTHIIPLIVNENTVITIDDESIVLNANEVWGLRNDGATIYNPDNTEIIFMRIAYSFNHTLDIQANTNPQQG